MAKHDAAAVILEQMGGAGRIHAMTGATILVDTNEVSFKLKRGAKVNYAKVTYNPDADLYDLEFGNVRGGMNFKYTVVAEVSGVYADQRRRIFEKETGLYLSL